MIMLHSGFMGHMGFDVRVVKCARKSVDGTIYSLMMRIDDHMVMMMNMMQAGEIVINHHIIIWAQMEIDRLVMIIIMTIKSSMMRMIICGLIIMRMRIMVISIIMRRMTQIRGKREQMEGCRMTTSVAGFSE